MTGGRPQVGRTRPADAASLMILDGRGTDARVLMGRRSTAHAFMPDVYVFPGGRVDRADGRAATTGALRPEDERRILAHTPRPSPARARAMAVAALRETVEETGLVIGDGAAHDLSPLRYVARAITPPGRSRRFDARFFACPRSAVAFERISAAQFVVAVQTEGFQVGQDLLGG